MKKQQLSKNTAETTEAHWTDLTDRYQAFETELTSLLNRYSMENASNTPDFILADYLLGCLKAYNDAVKANDAWRKS